MTFPEFYTNKAIQILNNHSARKSNQIFVFLGQVELIDKTILIDNLIDIKTFHLNGNEELFDRNWFTVVFTKLNTEKNFHLLSYAQFSYLISYIDGSFFKERIINRLWVELLKTLCPAWMRLNFLFHDISVFGTTDFLSYAIYALFQA